MRDFKLIFLTFLLNAAFLPWAFAQPGEGFAYPPVNENKLIETKWMYTYVTHAETDTRIHQADQTYEYFLYLKYDFTYEQYLNGENQTGSWSLNKDKNEIFYDFRNVKWWKIAEFTEETLVLEFVLPSNGATYQYHFVKVDDKKAPFKRRPNVLPSPDIEALAEGGKSQDGPRRKEKRPKKKWEPKEKKEEPVFIEIALVGGGYFGGVDPVLKDYILVKNNGRVIKEYESLTTGLQKSKKNITREELEQLASFIISKNFFEYKRLYDCETILCKNRKSTKPTPIPLRLSVKYGSRYKVVTVSIWGLDDRKLKYVDYPTDLDLIIKSIQNLADFEGGEF